MNSHSGNGSGPELLPDAPPPVQKPYLLVGAGSLTATVWKRGAELSAGTYRFNIVRTERRTGRVTQQLTVRQLRDLAKLVRMLALALEDDGCLPVDDREDLRRLAADLRVITASRIHQCNRDASTDANGMSS